VFRRKSGPLVARFRRRSRLMKSREKDREWGIHGSIYLSIVASIYLYLSISIDLYTGPAAAGVETVSMGGCVSSQLCTVGCGLSATVAPVEFVGRTTVSAVSVELSMCPSVYLLG